MSINLSNLTISRVSAGSSAAVPSATDPYWSSVSLLTETTGINTQNNNVFLDSSTNNFTVTRAGSTTQGSFTPFTVANSASYNTATNGGSGYFNGSTDYLSVADNAALQMGSGDFTLEFWLNFNSLSNYQTIFDKGYSSAGAIAIQTGLGTGGLIVYMSGSAAITETSGGTVGSWIHYALVRNGSSLTLYRNGSSVGTATNSTNLNSTAVLSVAGNVTGATRYYFNGFMSSFRMVKGTAVYTSNFTPSTTPLTAITGTQLLLSATNAGIYDAATKNNMITQGNAQVSTTVKKFGITSMKFDGTDDCLQSPNNAALQIMGGNCTIETWFYPTAFPPTVYGGPIVGKTNASNGWLLRYSSSGALQWVHPGLNSWNFGPASLPLNAWYHVAIVKSGSTITGYVNGIQYPITSSTPSETTQPLWIGTGNNIGYFTGYIQDMRITKGVARYTTNFTPPTAAFPTS